MMNKILFIIIGIAGIFCSCTQIEQQDEIEPKQECVEVPTYKLYPTQNMWNFLKLNTSTGQISIVQFTVNEEDKRFEYTLNDIPLIAPGEILTPGRFELTETQNRWNYILLDQVSGAAYQVQWSFEEDKRFVIPIN